MAQNGPMDRSLPQDHGTALGGEEGEGGGVEEVLTGGRREGGREGGEENEVGEGRGRGVEEVGRGGREGGRRAE